MDHEKDKALNEVWDLVKENNAMLQKMRRAQNIATVFTILKWLVITGFAVGVYYFLQPLLGQLSQVYSGVGDFYQSTGSLFDNVQKTLTP